MLEAILAFVAAGLGAYLGSYLRQKGANLATKEDVGGITESVESVRRQHHEELERVRTELAKTVHVHRAQFETELRAYLDVWETLVEAQRATLQLRPFIDTVPEDEEERRDKRLAEFKESFLKYRNAIDRWRPFYPARVYEEVNELLSIYHEEAVDYTFGNEGGWDREYWDRARKNLDRINTQIESICQTIRARIEELTVAPE